LTRSFFTKQKKQKKEETDSAPASSFLYCFDFLFGCLDVFQFIKNHIIQYLDVGSLHTGGS